MRSPVDSDGRRRFLIAIGASHYGSPDFSDLDGVPNELRTVASVFERCGYERVLVEVALDVPRAGIHEAVSRFFASRTWELTDLVIVYFTGHGGASENQENHYLWPVGADSSRPSYTAIATSELARWIFDGKGARPLCVWVLLDVCYARAGGAPLAATLVRDFRFPARLAEEAGVLVTSAAAEQATAKQGAFSAALAASIEADSIAPRGQPYITPLSLLGEIGRRLKTQRPISEYVSVVGEPKFLRNPRYDRRYGGANLEEAEDGYAPWSAEERAAHFDPRSRGVELMTDHGDFFCGRRKALADVARWLTDAPTSGKMLVVTGGPGSGKSAIVSRVVAEGDPALRGRVARKSEGAKIPGVEVDLALHARRRSVGALVAQIAEKMGSRAKTGESLAADLRGKGTELRIVIDAIDEADAPAEVASDLLCPLAEVESVRLVVGARRNVLPWVESRSVTLDLDADENFDAEDIQGYAMRRLLNTEGSPYRGRPDLAARVAQAVAQKAGRSFPVRGLSGRGLARAERAIDPAEPGWDAWLPTALDEALTLDEAFENDFRRFGADEAKVRDLLLPLAFAEGRGLPQEGIWFRVAS